MYEVLYDVYKENASYNLNSFALQMNLYNFISSALIVQPWLRCEKNSNEVLHYRGRSLSFKGKLVFLASWSVDCIVQQLKFGTSMAEPGCYHDHCIFKWLRPFSLILICRIFTFGNIVIEPTLVLKIRTANQHALVYEAGGPKVKRFLPRLWLFEREVQIAHTHTEVYAL